MQITLEDCRWMDQLIKWHKNWNSSLDWMVGSPSQGMIKYVLPDHEVIITRGQLLLPSWPGVRITHLHMAHEEFLLAATWSNRLGDDLEYYVNNTVWPTGPVEDEMEYEATWVGDSLLFQEWLTEFKLWNSLTDRPVML